VNWLRRESPIGVNCNAVRCVIAVIKNSQNDSIAVNSQSVVKIHARKRDSRKA
jgi:hypothetical protein